MATFAVSKNDNGDILVVVDDIICVGIQQEWMDDKSDFYIADWADQIPGKIANKENPRTEAPYGELSKEDIDELNAAIAAL